MRPRSPLNVDVNVHVQVRHSVTGELLHEERGHNLIVLSGRNLIIDFLAGDDPDPIRYFALGSGTLPVQDTDTEMVNEVLREPIVQKIKSDSQITFKYFLGSSLLNGVTITAAGLFNKPAGPVLFARYLLASPIVKDNSKVFTFGWVITLNSVTV